MLRYALALLLLPTLAAANPFAGSGESGNTTLKSFGHIQISTDTNAETTLSANTVFVKAAGTCANGDLVDFHEDTECRLTYIGTQTKEFLVEVSISVVKADGGPTVGYFRIAKNGDPTTDDAFAEQSIRTLSNTSDIGALSITRAVKLSTGDYIELWIATGDSDNLTIHGMVIIIDEK